MIIAMLLAHLLGDYVFQWDTLAAWKSRSLCGVAVHGAIVLVVTVFFAALIDPAWWLWAFFIGLMHIAIDGSWVAINRSAAARSGRYGLVRLLTDQALHIGVILLALCASGYLSPATLPQTFVHEVQTHRLWAIALGYVFVSLPAWIFIEFTLYGLIAGSAPDFTRVRQFKYVGSLERGLILTFVATGQYILVPVVALPRLVLEGPTYFGDKHTTLYLAEWLGSLALAVFIGLILGRM